MNLQGMGMNMNINTSANFGGLSDTGAAPDQGMHPNQMYQSNFVGSSLAQYQALNAQQLS